MKVYVPPLSVPGAQSRKNDAILPKWFNSLDTNSTLRQFFIMFPDIKDNEFYITGESYAGKYVPALAHKIHTLNPLASEKISLKVTLAISYL